MREARLAGDDVGWIAEELRLASDLFASRRTGRNHGRRRPQSRRAPAV